MKYKKISIIIPVYNEQKFVQRTLDRVIRANTLGLAKEIIIINDGSTDNTPTILNIWCKRNKSRQASIIKLIHHKKNIGKGAAVKAGMKKATGDLIIIQDSDMEYNPKDYHLLIKPFFSNKVVAVYGSRTKGITRYHNKYSSHFYYIGGMLLTWYTNILFSQNLTDQPTGYKVLSKQVYPLIDTISENDFSFEIGITALLAKNNFRIIEVPISYKPRSIAEGKKINFLDFIKSLYIGLKYRFFYDEYR